MHFPLKIPFEFWCTGGAVGGSFMKDDLIDLPKKILQTNVDLGFLSDLDPKDLETLTAVIRDRIDQKYFLRGSYRKKSQLPSDL